MSASGGRCFRERVRRGMTTFAAKTRRPVMTFGDSMEADPFGSMAGSRRGWRGWRGRGRFRPSTGPA